MTDRVVVGSDSIRQARGECAKCGMYLDWEKGHPVLMGFGHPLPTIYCAACCPTCARGGTMKPGVRG